MSQNVHPLKSLNSFSLASSAKHLSIATQLQDLQAFSKQLPDNFYILGGGSNSLFIEDFDGTILCPQFAGIKVRESDAHYYIEAACGENWHELVEYCLQYKMPGMENLALIPGNCGAAPIQNIGAYGIEFADVCDYVRWFDFSTQQETTLTAEQCEFGYRNSIFKNQLKDKGVITAVGIKLAKQWQPKLNYQGLNELGDAPTPKQVFDKVIEIRQSKLPDPAVLPNAGSFFKNPIVDEQVYLSIKEQHPNMPAYATVDGQFKLAAGWLIDRCELKGKQIGGAAVHKLQALVLVNIDNAQGIDVVKLANFVQQKVKQKFKVTLEPEVRIIASRGETRLEDTTYG